MRKRLTGEQLFPMVCRNSEAIESLRCEAVEKCFEFYEDIGMDGWIDDNFLSDNYFDYAKDAKDPTYEKVMRIRADMALLDELTLDNYNKPPFTSFNADDVTYDVGKEYFVYLTRDIAGKYHIRLMPISYYAIMKIVPDYKRQKPYVKEWEKGCSFGIYTAAGGKVYHLNLDRWDLIGSIRKNGKALGQISVGLAKYAYDAYNATLKYIQESGMLENHTFEEAYDIVCYLVETVCRACERYAGERIELRYKSQVAIYDYFAVQKACKKIIPDGKRLYSIVKIAMEFRSRLAGYRFGDGAMAKGWDGCGVNTLKRFQIRKVREFV